MGIESFSTTLNNEWQEVLAGVGTVQIQTVKKIMVKIATTMPTSADGAFYKAMYDEVTNTDPTYNIYVKGTTGRYIGSVSTWKVI